LGIRVENGGSWRTSRVLDVMDVDGGEIRPVIRVERKRAVAARRPSQTSEHEDPVRVYLDAIGRHPLLTKDDEVRLSQDIEAGRAAREALDAADSGLSRADRRALERTARRGERAWDTFVESNLRLVVSIAKRYQASGLPLLDLVQEGNLGLMHAV